MIFFICKKNNEYGRMYQFQIKKFYKASESCSNSSKILNIYTIIQKQLSKFFLPGVIAM